MNPGGSTSSCPASIAGNLDTPARVPERAGHRGSAGSRGGASSPYSDVRKSLGSVDDEAGQRWWVEARGEHVNGGGVSKLFGAYDCGIPLPLGHSSIWSRSAAGLSPQPAANPFANFFFGAFGNNWIDHLRREALSRVLQPARRGTERDRRPQFPQDRARVERPAAPIPPRRDPGVLRHLGACRGVRPYPRHQPRRRRRPSRRSDLGGQIDVRIGALSALELTASFGAATAFERGAGPRHQLFASLKVLR